MAQDSERRPGERIRPLCRGERFNWLIDRVNTTYNEQRMPEARARALSDCLIEHLVSNSR